MRQRLQLAKHHQMARYQHSAKNLGPEHSLEKNKNQKRMLNRKNGELIKDYRNLQMI